MDFDCNHVMRGIKYFIKTIFAPAICSVLLFNLIALGATGHRKECTICGMWIDQNEHTHHEAVLTNGEIEYFCSFACAAKYIRMNGDRTRTVMVADFLTKKLIDAEHAYYVEGSDVPGVMSYISLIAFETRERAAAFQAEHGGEIVTFAQALSFQ
jgi:copper chaperone NosL